MIDTLVYMRGRIEEQQSAGRFGLQPGDYLVVTLHRPALVDDDENLRATMRALRVVARELPVIFPVHPRTRASLDRLGLGGSVPELQLIEPLPYLAFLSLVSSAAAVLTDSGGIQEETAYLGVPCLTLRDNTERPVTVSQGTNILLGLEPDRILEVPRLADVIAQRPRRVPAGWDGRAGERLAEVVVQHLGVVTAASLEGR